MEIEVRDNRKKEWFWLDNEYLNGYARILGASCTVVYLSLCRHADNNTQSCYPSMKLIAEENGISERTVIRAIKILEEWGIVRVVRRKNDKGTQEVNIYTLTAKTVWKKKPSDTKSVGKPSDKNDKNRVTQSHKNNTQFNNTTFFIIKNTNTGGQCKKHFSSEIDAKHHIHLMRYEWENDLPFLKVVKVVA